MSDSSSTDDAFAVAAATSSCNSTTGIISQVVRPPPPENVKLLRDALDRSMKEGSTPSSTPTPKKHVTKCGYCMWINKSWQIRFKPFGRIATRSCVSVLAAAAASSTTRDDGTGTAAGAAADDRPMSRWLGRLEPATPKTTATTATTLNNQSHTAAAPAAAPPPAKLVHLILQRAELCNILQVARRKVFDSGRGSFQTLTVPLRDGTTHIDLAPYWMEISNVKRLHRSKLLGMLDYAIAVLESKQLPQYATNRGSDDWIVTLAGKPTTNVSHAFQDQIQAFLNACLSVKTTTTTTTDATDSLYISTAQPLTPENEQVAGAATGETPRFLPLGIKHETTQSMDGKCDGTAIATSLIAAAASLSSASSSCSRDVNQQKRPPNRLKSNTGIQKSPLASPLKRKRMTYSSPESFASSNQYDDGGGDDDDSETSQKGSGIDHDDQGAPEKDTESLMWNEEDSNSSKNNKDEAVDEGGERMIVEKKSVAVAAVDPTPEASNLAASSSSSPAGTIDATAPNEKGKTSLEVDGSENLETKTGATAEHDQMDHNEQETETVDESAEHAPTHGDIAEPSAIDETGNAVVDNDECAESEHIAAKDKPAVADHGEIHELSAKEDTGNAGTDQSTGFEDITADDEHGARDEGSAIEETGDADLCSGHSGKSEDKRSAAEHGEIDEGLVKEAHISTPDDVTPAKLFGVTTACESDKTLAVRHLERSVPELDNERSDHRAEDEARPAAPEEVTRTTFDNHFPAAFEEMAAIQHHEVGESQQEKVPTTVSLKEEPADFEETTAKGQAKEESTAHQEEALNNSEFEECEVNEFEKMGCLQNLVSSDGTFPAILMDESADLREMGDDRNLVIFNDAEHSGEGRQMDTSAEVEVQEDGEAIDEGVDAQRAEESLMDAVEPEKEPRSDSIEPNSVDDDGTTSESIAVPKERNSLTDAAVQAKSKPDTFVDPQVEPVVESPRETKVVNLRTEMETTMAETANVSLLGGVAKTFESGFAEMTWRGHPKESEGTQAEFKASNNRNSANVMSDQEINAKKIVAYSLDDTSRRKVMQEKEILKTIDDCGLTSRVVNVVETTTGNVAGWEPSHQLEEDTVKACDVSGEGVLNSGSSTKDVTEAVEDEKKSREELASRVLDERTRCEEIFVNQLQAIPVSENQQQVAHIEMHTIESRVNNSVDHSDDTRSTARPQVSRDEVTLADIRYDEEMNRFSNHVDSSRERFGLLDDTHDDLGIDVNIEPSTGEAATESDAAEILALTADGSFDFQDLDDDQLTDAAVEYCVASQVEPGAPFATTFDCETRGVLIDVPDDNISNAEEIGQSIGIVAKVDSSANDIAQENKAAGESKDKLVSNADTAKSDASSPTQESTPDVHGTDDNMVVDLKSDGDFITVTDKSVGEGVHSNLNFHMNTQANAVDAKTSDGNRVVAAAALQPIIFVATQEIINESVENVAESKSDDIPPEHEKEAIDEGIQDAVQSNLSMPAAAEGNTPHADATDERPMIAEVEANEDALDLSNNVTMPDKQDTCSKDESAPQKVVSAQATEDTSSGSLAVKEGKETKGEHNAQVKDSVGSVEDAQRRDAASPPNQQIDASQEMSDDSKQCDSADSASEYVAIAHETKETKLPSKTPQKSLATVVSASSTQEESKKANVQSNPNESLEIVQDTATIKSSTKTLKESRTNDQKDSTPRAGSTESSAMKLTSHSESSRPSSRKRKATVKYVNERPAKKDSVKVKKSSPVQIEGEGPAIRPSRRSIKETAPAKRKLEGGKGKRKRHTRMTKKDHEEEDQSELLEETFEDQKFSGLPTTKHSPGMVVDGTHWEKLDHRCHISDYIYGGNGSLAFGETTETALKAVQEELATMPPIETLDANDEEKIYLRSFPARTRLMNAEKAARRKEKAEYESIVKEIERQSRRAKKTPEQIEYETFLGTPIVFESESDKPEHFTKCIHGADCIYCGSSAVPDDPVVLEIAAPEHRPSTVTDSWRENCFENYDRDEPSPTGVGKKSKFTAAAPTNSKKRRSQRAHRNSNNKAGLMLLELKHSLEFVNEYNQGYIRRNE